MKFELDKSLSNLLLANLEEGISIKNKNKEYLDCNINFIEFFNFQNKANILGKSSLDIFNYETAEKLDSFDNETIEKKTVSEIEISMFVKKEKVYFVLKNIPILDENSEIKGIIGITKNITKIKLNEEMMQKDLLENKRLHNEVLLAKLDAEKANNYKSQFLANMSHEIRTPMNGVLGIISLLEGTQLTSEQNEYLDLIKLSGNFLMQLIEDILDFSKIEAGAMELEIIDFDLRELIEKTVETFQIITARKKEVKIVFSVGKEIPARLIGDPIRLKQVLFNLLGNAFKFTEKGFIEIRVDCVEKIKDILKLRFYVKDTGIGISDERKQAIFKPFVQEDGSYVRKFGGTGLGLSISKSIVKMMGGEIWLESEKGKGSTFFFTAHFKEGKSYILDEKKECDRIKKEILENEKINVLIVEDNYVNQRFMMGIAYNSKYNAYLANDGVEALEIFKESRIDIIIMDIQLPEMDGFATTKKIREIEKERKTHTPIIAVTAYAQTQDREKCIASGMDEYLAKPVKLRELFEVLDKFVKIV